MMHDGLFFNYLRLPLLPIKEEELYVETAVQRI